MLAPVSFAHSAVISSDAPGAYSVYAEDLDGDGDLDVLSASSDDSKVAWYENTDGRGSFGPQQVISTLVDLPRAVYAADVDGDGDADVLSTSLRDNKVAWYENTDGRGSFGSQQVIATVGDGAWALYAADLDGDSDVDVLSSSIGDGTIAWHNNTDGRGDFSHRQVITTEADSAHSLYAADIDSDGDLDVLSASSGDDKITWYENTDGRGSFGSQKVITTEAWGARSLCAADLDNDGDVDVLSASTHDDKIAWYENTDGRGNFGPQNVITTEAYHAYAVYAADVDQDGDVDVLSAAGGWSGGHELDRVAWYENNLNGRGGFGLQRVITTEVQDPVSMYAVDIDNDGDIDVFSVSGGSGEIAWYENLGSPIPGDANLDGRVDALDLNVVSTYWQGRDKVWAQGDFTGDGVVDADDLNQLALNWQSGVAATAAASAVQRDDTF
jgi:hypothetical protein